MENRYAVRLIAFALLAELVVSAPPADAQVDISVEKSIDIPVFSAFGMDLREFSITVSNGGTVAAPVEVTVRLPAGLTIPAGLSAVPDQGTFDPEAGLWSVGYLEGGTSAVLRIPVVADGAARGCLTNTAVAAISDHGVEDVDAANNEASVVVAASECSQLTASSRIRSE